MILEIFFMIEFRNGWVLIKFLFMVKNFFGEKFYNKYF